jgi:hypothetical protein
MEAPDVELGKVQLDRIARGPLHVVRVPDVDAAVIFAEGKQELERAVK